jgi:hypothetical protein
MKKVQNILLVFAFLTFLNQTHVRAEDSLPVLPLPPKQTPSIQLQSKDNVVVKKVDSNSGLSRTLVVISKDKDEIEEKRNINVLLLEAILMRSSDADPLRYIGQDQDKIRAWDPKLYNAVHSITKLKGAKGGNIERFLQTNFKTEYLSSEFFNEQNPHLAKPIYMSDVVKWAFEAVAVGNIDSLRVLLDNYSFLTTIKNDDGYGLLSYSILHGRNNIAYMLVYRGFNLNELNKYMASPINIAARTNNIEAVKLLVDSGVKVNEQDAFGKNALDYALMNNNQEMYGYLLKSKGA